MIATVAGYVTACRRAPQRQAASVVLRIGASLPTDKVSGSGLTTLLELLTTEPLVANDPDGRQSGRLASAWEWDESHTVLTIKLSPQVFFQDGTPLTADLAAEALRRVLARRTAVSLSSVNAITATAADLVQVRLTTPDSFLMPDLGTFSLTKPGAPEIGTGPYILRRQGDRIVLDAFTRYHHGRPAIDRIEIDRYPTQRTAWAAMMRGDIDVLHEVSRDAADFVEAESTVNAYSFPYPYYIPLVFNVRHPVLRRAEVRRALTEAVDREAIVKDALRGRGRPAYGPLWPEHWAYTARPPSPSFQPATARLRLDSAGLPVRKDLSGAMPSRFAFTCLVYADDPRFERVALMVQKQLAEIGVDMRLEPIKQADLAQRTSTGDFDAFLIQMAGRSLSWVYTFWHSPADARLMMTGYTAADSVLDRIRRSTSDAEIQAGVGDLTRVFEEDPPAIFLAWQVQSRAVSTRFDVRPEPNRDILANIWQWRPAAPQLAAAR